MFALSPRGNVYAKFHQHWSTCLGGDREHTNIDPYATITIV